MYVCVRVCFVYVVDMWGLFSQADAQVAEPDFEISAEAEDEYEEETDYVMSYFDNGEDEFYDELEDADGGEAYYD